MVRRGIIFLAGDFDTLPPGIEFKENDLIIAADGGYEYLKKLNIKPDFLVGDFDSLDNSELTEAKTENVNILQWPQQKDFTDGEIALDLALQQGCQSLLFLGAWGGNRPDHSLGNLALLHLLMKKNVKGLVFADGFYIRLCGPGKYAINGNKDNLVSLIPLTPTVKNIETKGLLYSLKDFDLFIGQSRGLSNQFLQERAVVSFQQGQLLLLWQGYLPEDF